MTITAAADGSALGNPGPAGWAWYVDDSHWAAGGWKHATNNQGELKAVLELFRATAHLDEDLLVLCDSQYVINSVTKWMPGWKKKGWRKGDGKPVMNLDLLQELDAALVGRTYRFEWVKGHANHPLNEAADERARGVAEAFQRGGAIPSGPGWAGHVGADPVAGAAEAEAEPEASVAVAADVVDVTPDVGADASVPGSEMDVAETDVAESDVAPGAAGEVDEQPGLFTLDEQMDPEHEVNLTLTEDEYFRAVQRARFEGVSVEDLLRSLI
ncbi:RNase H family protein [Glaciibacter superstes]|uniref:RNase H family protein n=1 Tax=Glaciibacter superstes TaxID=501023 RepID=UPI0003F4C88E|nr:RNase H family protein [Glaciibacter superstes]